MSELDEQWALALAEAAERARAHGRRDLAEYISLRAENDLARKTSVEWLFETFMSLAGEANRAGASIRITHGDAHRFQAGQTTMVGSLLTFHMGVRKLMIEAGWPRTPRDGFVRGGGLAGARVRHFGERARDEELLLVRASGGVPEWLVLEKTGERTSFTQARIRGHLKGFMGQSKHA